jgi:hypothetical protein
MDFDTIKLRRDGGVLFAALAAPPMNLLGPELVRDWVSLITLDSMSSDDPVLAAWFCRSCARHSQTLLDTMPARLCAGLAVGLRMSGALRAACLAYVRAQMANVHRIRAVTRHVGRCDSANRSAVQVEANTLRHHRHVVLLQTCARAVVAGIGARVARFDSRLIASWAHEVLLMSSRRVFIVNLLAR